MTALYRTQHRTKGYSAELELAISTAHCGQAHFAGTGPSGKVCGDCVHWLGTKRKSQAPCAKFTYLTSKKGPPVPRDLAACKYFSPEISANAAPADSSAWHQNSTQMKEPQT